MSNENNRKKYWSENDTYPFEKLVQFVKAIIVYLVLNIGLSIIEHSMYYFFDTANVWTKPTEQDVIIELTKKSQFLADKIVDKLTDPSTLVYIPDSAADRLETKQQIYNISLSCDWTPNDAILVNYRNQAMPQNKPDILWFTYQCQRTCDSLQLTLAIILDYQPEVVAFQIKHKSKSNKKNNRLKTQVSEVLYPNNELAVDAEISKKLDLNNSSTTPLIIDNYLFYTKRNRLNCHNFVTNQQIWSHRNSSSNSYTGEVLMSRNKLIVYDSPEVQVINPNTGKLLWKTKSLAPPLLTDYYLLIKESTNQLVLLELQTGNIARKQKVGTIINSIAVNKDMIVASIWNEKSEFEESHSSIIAMDIIYGDAFWKRRYKIGNATFPDKVTIKDRTIFVETKDSVRMYSRSGTLLINVSKAEVPRPTKPE